MPSFVYNSKMKRVKNNPTTIFTDEDIQSFVELGEVLRKIHNRLLSEGYVIKDGKIIAPQGKKEELPR